MPSNKTIRIIPVGYVPPPKKPRWRTFVKEISIGVCVFVLVLVSLALFYLSWDEKISIPNHLRCFEDEFSGKLRITLKQTSFTGAHIFKIRVNDVTVVERSLTHVKSSDKLGFNWQLCVPKAGGDLSLQVYHKNGALFGEHHWDLKSVSQELTSGRFELEAGANTTDTSAVPKNGGMKNQNNPKTQEEEPRGPFLSADLRFYPTMTYAEILPLIQTGDLILSTGRTTYGYLIQGALNSEFSHSGIVYRRPPVDSGGLFDALPFVPPTAAATDGAAAAAASPSPAPSSSAPPPSSSSSSDDRLYVLESSTNRGQLRDCLEGTAGTGVHLVALRDKVTYGWYRSVAFRRIKLGGNHSRAAFHRSTAKMWTKYKDVRYQHFSADSFTGRFNLNVNNNYDTLFCSEFNALALADAGLLPVDSEGVCSNVMPSELSSEPAVEGSALRLSGGAQFYNEIFLRDLSAFGTKLFCDEIPAASCTC